MFIYVVAAFLSILLGNIGLMNMGEWTSLKGFIYAEWLSPVFGDYLGSLVLRYVLLSLTGLLDIFYIRKNLY